MKTMHRLSAAVAAFGLWMGVAGAVTLNGPTRGVDSVDQYNRAVAGFSTGSFGDNITAHANGGQTSCQQLWNQTNRVTTVTNSGDSVCLPNTASQPPGISNGTLAGTAVTVINAGANPMQVFGFNTDTINGVASGTGVSQMPNSVVTYNVANVGVWVAQGLGTGFSNSLPTQSFKNGLTASTTQTQGAGTLITTQLSTFTTVANNNDAATLPPALPGLQLTVINNGNHTLQVFPASATQGGVTGGDAINGGSQNASVTIASPPAATIFYCTVAGTWLTK